MERIHTESYEEAYSEMLRLKSRSDDSATVVRIVKSPYHGFDVFVIEHEVYSEMISSQLIDGLPPILPVRDRHLTEVIG